MLRASTITAIAAFFATAAHAGVVVRCDIVDNHNNARHWDYSIYNHGDNASEITYTKNGNGVSGGSGLWNVVYDNAKKAVALIYVDDPRYQIVYANKYAPNAGDAALYLDQTVIGQGRCVVQSGNYTPPVQTYDPPVQPSAPAAPSSQTSTTLLPDWHGGLTAPVALGGLPYSALVDTGNSFQLSVPMSVASELVSSGQAQWLDKTSNAIMANGSVERESMIVINSVVIAGRTAYGVEATVSGETVIVGLPLLYKISGGKFSFDHGSLVFGG